MTTPAAADGPLPEGRFRQTLETIALVAIALDRDGRITFANDFFLALTGRSREEVLGGDWFELFHPDSEVREDYLARMRTGEIEPHFAGTVTTRDGERRAISWSTTLQRDAAGAPIGIVSIGEDVTDRLRAEEVLREREELFRSLIEHVSDVICIVGADGTVLYGSPAVERLLGRKPEELVGTPALTLVHDDDVETACRVLDAALAGEPPAPALVRLHHRDGAWKTVEALCTRLDPADADGEPAVVGNFRDVTDQRRLQEQLVNSQRLDAIGRLAGGIAHDFNNILTAIGGYSDFLASSFDAADERREDALEIVRATERASALTAQLLAFSRSQVLETELLDLGELVGGLGRLLGRLVGGEVELVTEIEPGLRVEADRAQLERVLTNLVVNARDAMPGGGRLEIGLRRAGPSAELTVADDGAGMDAETLAHAFEPFFTTKGPDKGTGLGLATAYGIVVQAGGEITVESEPGAGTTFRILLPLVQGPVDAEHGEADVQQRLGTETVLLAEDEETIRRLVGEVLGRSGYRVHTAATGIEALELVRTLGPGLDLLVTDVVMPGMSGPELARAAAELSPGLRVLYTSGYASEPDEAFDDPDVAFIGKPFSPQTLVAKVREVLDG